MNRKHFFGMVLVLIVIAASIYRYMQYAELEANPVVMEVNAPASSIVIREEEVQKIAGKTPIKLYFLDANTNGLRVEMRYVPDGEINKGLENICIITVNELIRGPAESSGLERVMPEGLQLNAVVVSGDRVELDFNEMILVDDARVQELIVASLERSLKDNHGFTEVVITKEGEEVGGRSIWMNQD